MEFINQVIGIVIPNVYVESIDFKDAFYSILIHLEHQKYFKFVVLSKIYDIHACLMFMAHSCASLQKYPKSPFHIYEVKAFYQ